VWTCSEEAQITVPCALVQQSPGGALKAYQASGNAITATLSWQDIIPRTAPVVSWEFWSNSNDECGVKCERQQQFMRDVKAPVMAMMQARVMTFSPHYITLQCGSAASTEYCQKQARVCECVEAVHGTRVCVVCARADCSCALTRAMRVCACFCVFGVQCINKGRYCQMDPDGTLDVRCTRILPAHFHGLVCCAPTFTDAHVQTLLFRRSTRAAAQSGYSGRDVVLENLRSLCVFRALNQSGTPWTWWRCVLRDETCPHGTFVPA
jgi:hypothetical protein